MNTVALKYSVCNSEH